jgi:NADP-dependent 3-hydroxy acid dehydrogenase YdfG
MPNNSGVVIVTGAGTGIGRASCEALADAGFAVAALGRRLDRLADYQTNGTVVAYACDVRDEAQVEKCIAEISDSLGDVRGLVNAAGIIVEQPITDVTVTDIRNQFATNFEAVVTMILHCLPGLQTHGRPRQRDRPVARAKPDLHRRRHATRRLRRDACRPHAPLSSRAGR